MVTVEAARQRVANQLVASAEKGIALQPTVTGRNRLWSTVRVWNAALFRVLEKLDFHRDHVAPDDDGKGELVCLTRTLP